MSRSRTDGLTAMTRRLLDEHGPLMNAAAAAKILGFKNTDALRTARNERRLPVPMFTIPGRRGWFASTEAVGAWLERVLPPVESGTD